MKLDTLTLVETPEGIDLQAELVGLVPRTLAYTVDFMIRMLCMFCLGLLLMFLGEAGIGLLFVIFFLLEWWYPVLFEVFRGGQTPGKKAFNIKVVNDDLTPISFGASLTRNLLRAADMLPNFYIFGATSMTLTQRFQRLGDLAAGTIVVYLEHASHKQPSLDEITAITPQHPLTQEQQIAFINFTLNRGQISSDRQDEIANIIKPCIPLNSHRPSDYVRGVGKWLLGAKSLTTQTQHSET